MSKPDHENVLQHVVFYGDPEIGSGNISALLRRAAEWFDGQEILNALTGEAPIIRFDADESEWVLSVLYDFADSTLKEVREAEASFCSKKKE